MNIESEGKMMIDKVVNFDMDGTIADLYSVKNWLPMLRKEDPTPYLVAQPMVDMAELATILFILRCQGYAINVITWLAMDSNESYKKATRQAKAQWLKENVPFIFDKIHMVQYGTPKHRLQNGVLVDDNTDVLNGWINHGGLIINAKKENWLDDLRGFLT
jgi:5'(3')-deoxyribonucleotidase